MVRNGAGNFFSPGSYRLASECLSHQAKDVSGHKLFDTFPWLQSSLRNCWSFRCFGTIYLARVSQVYVFYPVQKEAAVLPQMYDSIWSGFRWVNTCTWKSNTSTGSPLPLAQGSSFLTGQGERAARSNAIQMSPPSPPLPTLPSIVFFVLWQYFYISKGVKEPRKSGEICV